MKPEKELADINAGALDDILAIAIDEIDRITTVALGKNKENYYIEVIYSPEFDILSEKHKFGLDSSEIESKFLQKIASLEKRNHEFEITWFKNI